MPSDDANSEGKKAAICRASSRGKGGVETSAAVAPGPSCRIVEGSVRMHDGVVTADVVPPRWAMALLNSGGTEDIVNQSRPSASDVRRDYGDW